MIGFINNIICYLWQPFKLSLNDFIAEIVPLMIQKANTRHHLNLKLNAIDKQTILKTLESTLANDWEIFQEDDQRLRGMQEGIANALADKLRLSPTAFFFNLFHGAEYSLDPETELECEINHAVNFFLLMYNGPVTPAACSEGTLSSFPHSPAIMNSYQNSNASSPRSSNSLRSSSRTYSCPSIQNAENVIPRSISYSSLRSVSVLTRHP